MIDAELLLRRGHAAEEAGDFATARSCFEQGIALGDVTAMNRLASMFDVGVGVSADKARAMRLYCRAWRSRNAAAANNIAILYQERGNRRAMFRWFVRSAEAGDGDAYLEIAKCYRDGVGVRRSVELAVRSLAAALADPNIYEASREEAEEMMATFRPRLTQGDEA